MGVKKFLAPYVLFSGGVMTGTSTLTSDPTNIANLDNVGLQIAWTGTAVGTLSVKCSIDNVTYSDLTFSPLLAQPVGVAGGYLISLNQLPFPWIKLVYVNASGVGVLNAQVCAKDIN